MILDSSNLIYSALFNVMFDRCVADDYYYAEVHINMLMTYDYIFF